MKLKGVIILNKKEEKEFYDKIGKIIGWNFSKIKYNVIDNSKFKYFNEINKISCDKLILDIGTGRWRKDII